VLKRVAKVASLAVRHVSAYGDLITEDMRSSYDAFGRRFWVGVVLVVGVGFSVAMACVWAIALAWDTAGRLWLIAGLFGLFVTLSVAAFLVLQSLKGQRRGLLPKTELEWNKDRLLLDDLLSQPRGGIN
jgi:ABC-type sugar transport system permease subunit